MSETDAFVQNAQLHISYKSASVEPSLISPRLCFGFELSQGPINLRDANISKVAVNNFSNFVVELKLITSKSEEYIGQLFPKKPFVQLYSNNRAPLYFNLFVDHHILAQIEKLRESKDLQLVTYFDFTVLCPMEPQAQVQLNVQIRFKVPKSDWVESYLPALGFKTVSLIEIPQLLEPEFSETIAHVNDAWKQYSMGEYPRVLTDCRKAIESLSDKIKSKDFQKEVTEEDRKKMVPDWDKFLGNDELGDAVATINKKISRLTSTGAHPGRTICREDADFALMITHAMVNLVVRKFEANFN